MKTLTSQDESIVIPISKIACIRFIDDIMYYEQKGWVKDTVRGYYVQVSCDGLHYINVGHFTSKTMAKSEMLRLRFALENNMNCEISSDYAPEE